MNTINGSLSASMRLAVLLFLFGLPQFTTQTSAPSSTTSTTSSTTITPIGTSPPTIDSTSSTSTTTVSTTSTSTPTVSTTSTSTPTVSTTSTSTPTVSTTSTSTPTVSTTSTSTPTVSTSSTSTTTVSTSSTTTPTPERHCVLVDNPVRLRSNGAPPCIVNRFHEHSIQYRSPEFPEKYPNEIKCEARTSTVAPQFLEVTLALFKVHEHDRLVVTGPFRYRRRLQASDVGVPFLLPSSHANILFISNEKKRRMGFKLKVISKTNSCQRLCPLEKGDKGIIQNGPYGSDTFCEWWMEAPPRCFIRLTFLEFDVGQPGSGGAWGCDEDYVGVDRGGDPTYAHPNSRTFCGSTLPRRIRSVDNKMNVLFNGREGGYEGFRAKYEVICR